jgi:hypothetical protein
MSDMDADLADLSPDPVVERLVRDLASRCPLSTDRAANYVSLTPHRGRHVAVYADADHVSFALPPREADAHAVSFPDATLEPKSGVTTYIKIFTADLARSYAEVLQIGLRSLEFRSPHP